MKFLFSPLFMFWSAGTIFSAALIGPVAAQDFSWLKQHGDQTNRSAVALSSTSDFVYAGIQSIAPGTDHWDVELRSFDSSGNLLWTRAITSPDRDRVANVTANHLEKVFISGYTEGILSAPNNGEWDIFVACFDSGGTECWFRQFGSTGTDTVIDGASDGNGGLILVGATDGVFPGPSLGGFDAWLAHFDSAGNTLWSRQLGTSQGDSATAVALDGQGGMFVAGGTDGSLGGPITGTESDSWFGRFDLMGNPQWTRQLGSDGKDSTSAIAVDDAGNLYILGDTNADLAGTNPGFTTYDGWLAKYDLAGNQVWVRQFGTPEQEKCHALTIGRNGEIWAAGYTTGALGGPNSHSGSTDAWLISFDPDGIQTSVLQFGGTNIDNAYALDFDGEHSLYLCGTTENLLGTPAPSSFDEWVARFDPYLGISRYCAPAVAHSGGLSGSLFATGTNDALANQLSLYANDLPINQFGIFLASQVTDSVPVVAGSQGTLCLGGEIGRFNQLSQIQNSGSLGTFSLTVDTAAIPQPTGPSSIQAGETWNFQAWFRDMNPTSTSNFTDAVSITFE